MNRKIKWTFVFLCSIILLGLALSSLETAVIIYNLARYIRIPATIMIYANVLLFQGISFVSLAILIPLVVWWKEDQ